MSSCLEFTTPVYHLKYCLHKLKFAYIWRRIFQSQDFYLSYQFSLELECYILCCHFVRSIRYQGANIMVPGVLKKINNTLIFFSMLRGLMADYEHTLSLLVARLVTSVVGFGFLPQTFDTVMGTYQYRLLFCDC